MYVCSTVLPQAVLCAGQHDVTRRNFGYHAALLWQYNSVWLCIYVCTTVLRQTIQDKSIYSVDVLVAVLALL